MGFNSAFKGLMCAIYYSVVHKRLLIIMGALHYGWCICLMAWKCLFGYS